MDEMKIKSTFIGSLIGKFITKFLKKKFGVDIILIFDDLNIKNDKTDTYGNALIKFSIPTRQLPKLIFHEEGDEIKESTKK